MKSMFAFHEDKAGEASTASDEENAEKLKRFSLSSRKNSKEDLESSIRDMTKNDGNTLRALDRLRKGAVMNMDIDRSELDLLAKLLRDKLHLTVHRRMIHSYRDCFRGSEAVGWLSTHAIVTDPEDAKNIMRHLLYRRIILRVDHTKPLFNSAIHSITPSFAEWRSKKHREWYQDNVRTYNMSALYSFNVAAFSKYKLVVRVICAKGLRYTKLNSFTGKWKSKKVAPLCAVNLGDQHKLSTVEEKTSSPRWDEVFEFFFDNTLTRHEEIWIKVVDFRDIGESFPLGQCCIPTAMILRNCGVKEDEPPPVEVMDAPGWLCWQPLVPPESVPNPDEVRGGEIQLEFQVITNVAPSPDETVHDVCRPEVPLHLLRNSLGDGNLDGLVEIPDSASVAGRDDSSHPRTVIRYQHLDKRPESEIAKSRPKQSLDGSGTGGHLKLKGGDGEEHPDQWSLDLTSLEIRNVTDIPAGQIVWIEIIARSSKRSKFISKRRKQATKEQRKEMESETGVIARRRSPMFLWPKDGRSVVNAGRVSLPIPDDIARYVTIEMRLWRKGDISTTFVGKGRLLLHHVRKSLQMEEESDQDTQVDSDEEETPLVDSKRTSETISEKESQSANQSRRLTESVASVFDFGGNGDDDKQTVPEVDDLPFQKAVRSSHQDTKIIVLRRQAAFKRNIKIKSGQIYCYACLRPLLNDDIMDFDDFSEDETAPIETIDIEEALRDVVGSTGEIPRPITVPEPYSNVYIDVTINTSVMKLALMLLASDSKFAAAFAKERKNTDVVNGPWQLPKSQRSDSVITNDDDDTSSEPSTPGIDKNGDKREKQGDDDMAETPGSATSESFAGMSVAKLVDNNEAGEEEKVVSPSTRASPTKAKSDNFSGDEDDYDDVSPPREVKSMPAGDLSTGENRRDSIGTSDSMEEMRLNEDSAETAIEKVDEPSHPKRVITFTLPPTALTKSGPCTETQEILCIEPGGFVYTSTSETPTMPYADRFYTHSQFVVTYLSHNESRLRISGEPVWKDKGPPPFPVKGFVVNGVKNGHQEAYDSLVKMLKEAVAPKRVVRSKEKKTKKKEEEEEVEKARKPMVLWKKITIAVLATIFLAVAIWCIYIVFVAKLDIREEVLALSKTIVRAANSSIQQVNDALSQSL